MDGDRHVALWSRIGPFAAAMGDDRSTLDTLALGISTALRPGLDPRRAVAVLDDLAARCGPTDRDGIVRFLVDQGFRGDPSAYGRWEHSCLDTVLTTRRGMPITLSMVAIEVARRLGVSLAGVGMPGHFVVGDPGDPEWFADLHGTGPFGADTGLTPADCRARLRSIGISRWSEQFLMPVTNRMIVGRIVNNLRLSCERRNDRVRLAIVMRLCETTMQCGEDAHDLVAAMAVLN